MAGTPRPPTVVKLGGSVITRKSQEFRSRPKVIHRLAEELAAGWEGGKHPLIVLHGAGSFAHPTARAWGLASPPPGRANRARGAALTAHGVRRLHLLVMRALLDAGLPARSVPPFPSALNRAGKLQLFDLAPYRGLLARGDVPVSFGDVVIDETWGSSILSADTLALRLAEELPAPRVLFVSDVPGVLAPSAGAGRPKVVGELGEDVPEFLHAPEGAKRPDVTRGIRGKVEAMLAIAETGARAGLISGLQHGQLSRALRGEHVHGTWTRAARGSAEEPPR